MLPVNSTFYCPTGLVRNQSEKATSISPKIQELKTRYAARDGAITGESTTPHKHDCDCQHCRKHILGGTDLVECMMEGIGCQWALYFGTTRFCKHPSAKQFADSDGT